MNGNLNSCGCCEGVTALTHESIQNVAGLSALMYRVGTHGSFKSTMEAALARQAALRRLTTRKDDDSSIALLDSWATVLDVLAFYQERIVNEGYLRTAIEQRSILELARAIGYELNPGVAASTFLAFRLDETKGAPTAVTLEVGTKAQSIPGQDELPQTFETTEKLDARVGWNALTPRRTELLYPKFGTQKLYVQGTSTNLKAGDGLLIVGDERAEDVTNDNWDFRRVKSLTTVQPPEPTADLNAGYTIVELDRRLGSFTPFKDVAKKNPKVYALRQRANIFGYNAPDWRLLPAATKTSYYGGVIGDNWPSFTIFASSSTDTIELDTTYPQITDKSWLVLSLPTYQELYKIKQVSEGGRAEYGLSGKTTRVTLEGENLGDKYGTQVRMTMVFAQSEELKLAETPIATAVSGESVTLDQEVDGLTEGQLLAASGRESVTGAALSEVVILNRAESDGNRTTLHFAAALVNSYQRDSVTINANVARATHGETKIEILGSGDGSKAFQKFTLKQKPMTYFSAATAVGSQTTLEVRVNNLLWEEVSSLYEQGPRDRVYITRAADDGTVTVEFGDGITGARLPTGTENVIATYRVGIGLDGLVDAEQISLLMSRPLGLKSVINPLASSGAADPEVLDEARRNAPLTVLTLERIVSLQDFEDFTRAFSGIGKVQATLLWNGERHMVHITGAGAKGAKISPASELYGNLMAAIDAARHADQAVRVDSYHSLSFNVTAKILVDGQYVGEDVIAAMKTVLVKAFSFEARGFGQAVMKSDVLAVMQGVEGVVAVDLDALYLDGQSSVLNDALPARRAHWDRGAIQPAELLIIHPEGMVLTEMT